jgi:hypothetical protein
MSLIVATHPLALWALAAHSAIMVDSRDGFVDSVLDRAQTGQPGFCSGSQSEKQVPRAVESQSTRAPIASARRS